MKIMKFIEKLCREKIDFKQMRKYEENDVTFLELYSQGKNSFYPFAQISLTYIEDPQLFEIRLGWKTHLEIEGISKICYDPKGSTNYIKATEDVRKRKTSNIINCLRYEFIRRKLDGPKICYQKTDTGSLNFEVATWFIPFSDLDLLEEQIKDAFEMLIITPSKLKF